MKTKELFLLDSVPRKMCLIVIILQLNIICLAQEDATLNVNGDFTSRDLITKSNFPSGKIYLFYIC